MGETLNKGSASIRDKRKGNGKYYIMAGYDIGTFRDTGKQMEANMLWPTLLPQSHRRPPRPAPPTPRS